MINKIKVAAFGLFSLWAGNSYAQECHNVYPYVQGIVSDNNGYDLNGFIKNNTKDVMAKAPKIKEYSGDTWGYLQIRGVKVPSVDINRVDDKYEKNHLSYSQIINATLALCDTKNGIKATWWTRQCNNPIGPVFNMRTEEDSKGEVPIVKYTDITKELTEKKFTLIEYNNTNYNRRDYDQFVKNYITVEKGVIKEAEEYKTIIDFFNNFLTKFTYVEDPLLEDKSFLTFFSTDKNKFIGWFNIENSKLSGHIEPVDLQFERDRDTVVNHVFKKLKHKTVFVYGDEVFGMEKTLLNYGYDHHIKMIRRKTATEKKFNSEK
jgi:hypothetical protein